MIQTAVKVLESKRPNHFHKFFYYGSRYPPTALDRAPKYISTLARVFQVVNLFLPSQWIF